jgi:hypothetical protein
MDYNEYSRIKDQANQRAHQIVPIWLPDGRKVGNEWVAKNPTRNDKNAGSFTVNLKTGKWIDFATNEYGGSIVRLAMYLHGDRTPYEAAENLKRMMGGQP